MNPQWYRVQSQADPTVAEFLIVDLIGGWYDEMWRDWGVDPGVTAKQFLKDLAALGDEVRTIRVRINSPGGDVFAAVNIANALREQQVSKGRTVETYVDGLAASAASIVLMAGSRIVMADNALVMVHDPWSWAVGNAKDMRKVAEDLDTVRDTIVATYRWHVSLEDSEIRDLMAGETWMDADEAMAWGFATEKVEGLRAAARLDRRAVATLSVPEAYRARVEALLAPDDRSVDPPAAATAEAITQACAEAGLDLGFARALITEGVIGAQLPARVAAEQGRRELAAARQRDIEALCGAAQLPRELAQDFVAGAMPVDRVRHAVATIQALRDGKEIDGALSPDQSGDWKASWKSAFAKARGRAVAR